MNETCENKILLVDQQFQSVSTKELEELNLIIKDFVKDYRKNKDKQNLEEWLSFKIKNSIDDITDEESQRITNEIIDSIKIAEEKSDSLQRAIEEGRSKESWFANEVKQSMSSMGMKESVQYLKELDSTLVEVNDCLHKTIITKSGNINQNPNLDGFIAEQYHAQTFNLNAKSCGSKYRAKVLEPNGEVYAKNSVDIVIQDESGRIISKYQSKYCKNAKQTSKAFKKGDYRGQRKLVPDGQESQIIKSSNVIESPDGTTSNPLSKESAIELRDKAQNQKWDDLTWNDYKTQNIALNLGKQVGYATLQGAAIGVGFDVAQKIYNNEEIEAEELIETALKSGADFGIKAAVAGALKVAAEKEIISVIPKGTPAGTLANIAYVSIENVKVLGKVATGELSIREGLEKMEQTTTSAVTGLMASAKGAKIGAGIGTVLGLSGQFVGGLIGGTIGYMAGSKFGEGVSKCAQKVREKAKGVIKSCTQSICSFGHRIKNGITAISGLFSF